MSVRGLFAGATLVACAWVTASDGSGGWVIDVIGGPVTPANPTVRVLVSAAFPRELRGFAAGRFSIGSADLTSSFSEILLPPPLGPLPPGGYGCFAMWAGSHSNGVVHDAGLTQVEYAGCSIHRGNPLPVWEATWSTTDFRSRDVILVTTAAPTSEFRVWRDSNFNIVELVSLGLFFHGSAVIQVRPSDCYADCDSSTGSEVLDIFDFLCFQNIFAAGEPYACDCDTSTGQGVCDIFDFLCFQSRFAAGCP